jgi:hypothetical protein
VRSYLGIEDEDGNTYPGRAFLLDRFNNNVGDKTQGFYIFAYFIVPALAVCLLTLMAMYKLAVWMCCSRKLYTTSKVRTPSHPPRPSERTRREKVE